MRDHGRGRLARREREDVRIEEVDLRELAAAGLLLSSSHGPGVVAVGPSKRPDTAMKA